MVKRKTLIVNEWIYNLNIYIDEEIRRNRPEFITRKISENDRQYLMKKYFLNTSYFKFLFNDKGEIKEEYRK